MVYNNKMEENKKVETLENLDAIIQDEETSFDLRTIFTILVLNWQWFLLSMFIFVCGALIYLRYATPTYQMSVKMLIKEETNNRRSSNQMLANMQDLGFISNSAGIDNEIEILRSRVLAHEAVKDLKLYAEYRTKGRVTKQLVYRNQPVNVDMNPAGLDSLKDHPIPLIKLQIERKNQKYVITSMSKDMNFKAEFDSLPAFLETTKGTLVFTQNSEAKTELEDGDVSLVTISSPWNVAGAYVNALNVAPTSKLTSIAELTLRDQNPKRAEDYLKQLALCYNRQANADKNEIAFKTEEFINNRLQKISDELGTTESELENYKRRNSLIQLNLDASQALTQSNQYEAQLAQANTEMLLLEYLREYVDKSENKYQLIPSNVGLTDPVSSSLIATFNQNVQERNRMLESASSTSPQVLTLTNTLDRLQSSIHDALVQARKAADIRRQGIQKQADVYKARVAESPERERILTQIGRQQEVKAGLYLMLLQKREENSISLAATADKGKLIDEPAFGGKVSPKNAIIMLAALVLGFGLPLLFLYILQLLRYKIEGHEDVLRLTQLPIVGDVAVANESAKSAAGIVVHENKNNQIDEIFRSMRTNIQFMMNKDQKVIMFTSSTSGEGKTFNAANLAASFAFLGKKTILLGLDIRKPALGRLFGVTDRSIGITSLLVRDKVTKDDVQKQIRNSGVNDNLDLLLAGPTPPNPTELLARKNLGDVIDLLREMYDYIILDTAPVGLVTDSLEVARHTDVSVFVCRADYTPKTSFGLLNSLANDKKIPNPCVVINGIDMSKKKYGYYYGYGKYGKYGRYGYGYGKYGYGRYGYGRYGGYGYGSYGGYGNYNDSHYGNKDDNSIKK